jgi:hypothetical protein
MAVLAQINKKDVQQKYPSAFIKDRRACRNGKVCQMEKNDSVIQESHVAIGILSMTGVIGSHLAGSTYPDQQERHESESSYLPR